MTCFGFLIVAFVRLFGNSLRVAEIILLSCDILYIFKVVKKFKCKPRLLCNVVS